MGSEMCIRDSIKTAMMTFAPLSRETTSNHGRLIRCVGRNAEQEDFAVRVPGHKTSPVAVPALELPVERTLQFWLQRRVQIEAQFDGGQSVFKGDGHQSVNRRFVKRKGKELNHLARGLDQSLVARLQPERSFMVELRPSPLKRGPAPLIARCNLRQPVPHQSALEQSSIEDAHVFVSFWGMMALFKFAGALGRPEDHRLVGHGRGNADKTTRGVRVGHPAEPQRQSVDASPAP